MEARAGTATWWMLGGALLSVEGTLSGTEDVALSPCPRPSLNLGSVADNSARPTSSRRNKLHRPFMSAQG